MATTVTVTIESGSYALFATDVVEPRLLVFLERGQTIGFERDDRDRLVAVAGRRELPLDERREYYWRRI